MIRRAVAANIYFGNRLLAYINRSDLPDNIKLDLGKIAEDIDQDAHKMLVAVTYKADRLINRCGLSKIVQDSAAYEVELSKPR